GDTNTTSADDFTVTVEDEAGVPSAPATISLTIEDEPDAPVITGTLALTVTAGGTTAAITSAILGATDPDSPATAVLFKVSTAPTHGTVNVSGSPATQFTLADVNGALVAYAFAGDSNVTSADSFAVTVE